MPVPGNPINKAMRSFEFLTERVASIRAPAKSATPNDEADSPEIESLKLMLSSKIKELPTDPATMKLLQEIEDLLASIGAGSRTKYVGNVLQGIEDPDVNNAQKLLAKYFMSLDASPKDRQAMVELWKADKLVNVKMLLTPGKHTVAQLINGYDSNPAIKEMTDDLSQIAALGQGKGEFLLSVFSKKITKAEGKGDLLISGVGTVEVKTTDKGAGRFTDQQVKPTTKYQAAVNDFRATFKDIIEQVGIKSSGISIVNLIKLNGALNVKQRKLFTQKLTAAVSNLFPYATDMVGPIVDAIVAGNENQAKQRYAVANLNNYMAQKDDVGVLAINLAKDPYTFVFFTDNKSLNAGGMRLHSKTGYPIAADFRDAYPQTEIRDTSQAQE
jgi:hypothetical protein